MSPPDHLEDEVRRIWSFIDNGEFENAESSLREIEQEDSYLDIPEYNIVKAKYWLELGQLQRADSEIRRLKVKLDAFNTITQINILTLSAKIRLLESEFATSEKEIKEIYKLYDTLDITEKENNYYVIADTYNLHGMIFMSKNKFDEALQKFEESRIGYSKLNSPRQQGMVAYNSGKAYQLQENYDRALDFYQEATRFFQTINDIPGLNQTYSEMILCYQAKNDRDEVYVYEQRQRDLKEKLEFNNYKMESIREKNSLHDNIFKLNQQVASLEQEIFNLKFEVEASQTSSPHGLTKAIATSKADDYDELAENLGKLKSENRELFSKLKDYEVEVNDYKLYRLEQEQILKETSELLSSTQEQLHNYKKEIRAIKAKNDELAENLEEVKKENTNLQSQLTQKKPKKKSRKSKQDKKGEVPEDKELETLNQMLDELEGQNEQLIIKNSKLEAENKELTDILQKTEEALVQRETEITNVQLSKLNEVKGDNTKIKEMTLEIANLTAEVEVTSNKLQNAITERNELKKSNKKVQEELTNAQSELEQYKNEVEELKQQDKSIAKSTATELKETIRDNENKFKKLETKVKQTKSKLEKIEKEKQGLVKELEKEQSLNRSMSDEITDLKAKINSYKKNEKSLLKEFQKTLELKDAEMKLLNDELIKTKMDISEKPKQEPVVQEKVTEEKSELVTEEVPATEPIEDTPLTHSPKTPKYEPTIKFQQKDPAEMSLDELLATDKLVNAIYTTIMSRNKVKTRQLAMQLGISPANCSKIVNQLVEFGFVEKLDKSSNPVVQITNV